MKPDTVYPCNIQKDSQWDTLAAGSSTGQGQQGKDTIESSTSTKGERQQRGRRKQRELRELREIIGRHRESEAKWLPPTRKRGCRFLNPLLGLGCRLGRQ